MTRSLWRVGDRVDTGVTTDGTSGAKPLQGLTVRWPWTAGTGTDAAGRAAPLARPALCPSGPAGAEDGEAAAGQLDVGQARLAQPRRVVGARAVQRRVAAA